MQSSNISITFGPFIILVMIFVMSLFRFANKYSVAYLEVEDE